MQQLLFDRIFKDREETCSLRILSCGNAPDKTCLDRALKILLFIRCALRERIRVFFTIFGAIGKLTHIRGVRSKAVATEAVRRQSSVEGSF